MRSILKIDLDLPGIGHDVVTCKSIYFTTSADVLLNVSIVEALPVIFIRRNCPNLFS